VGVVDGPIHRCRGQQAGRVWFTSRGNEGIREGGRFVGVYKRGRSEKRGRRHAQSLGFKREMVSALLEEGGKISDHIESNLARRLSVASNVLYCLAAAACGNVKRWRSSRASSAGSSPRTAEPSTALSFRFNSRSAHRQRRPTSGGNDRQTLLWHFGTLWSSNAIRSFPSMQKHVLSQP